MLLLKICWLKPQDFMRQIVRAALPLGKGIILDPFMGSGSTIAAAAYLGLASIGLEVKGVFLCGTKVGAQDSEISDGAWDKQCQNYYFHRPTCKKDQDGVTINQQAF